MSMPSTENQPDTAQEKIDAERFNNWIKRMYWVAAAGLIITLGMFWYHVYYKNVGVGISKESGDWGEFGSYVGGILSPFFSFLAFVALLWTINIQIRALNISSNALNVSRDELKLTREELTKTAAAAQQQVHHFENESKRSDLYRIIEKLTERIDRNYKINLIFGNYKLIDFVWASDGEFRNQLAQLQDAYDDKSHSSVEFNTIIAIEHDLEQLLAYLKMYESFESGMKLLIFYRAEYIKLMEFLHARGMFLNQELFHDFHY